MGYPKKRLSARYEVRNRFGSLGWEIRADLLNIGLGGLGLRLPAYLEPGTIVNVSIRRDGDVLALDGTAKWCRPFDTESSTAAASGQRYQAGIAFSGALDDRCDALLDFINSTPTLSVLRGTFGRFVLDYDRPVLLRVECPIRVRQLSLSGMLVEAQTAPDPDSEVLLSIPFGKQGFLARGRVANVEGGDESETSLRIGIGFHDLTAAQRPVLEAFVEDVRQRLS